MATDDLEYGWYKWENGFRQKDGFFVDRAGRILYWPTRRGPGFVLDPRECEPLRRAIASAGPFLSWKLVLACLFMVFLFFDRVLPPFGLLSFGGDLFSALVWSGALLGLLAVWLLSRPRWQDLDLWSRSKINQRRPPVRDALLSVKALSTDAFWRRVTLFAALVCVLGILGVISFDDAVFQEPSRHVTPARRYVWAVHGLLFLSAAVFMVTKLINHFLARSSSHSIEYLVSWIKEREGLTLQALRQETDGDPDLEERRLSAERLKKALDKAHQNNRGL